MITYVSNGRTVGPLLSSVEGFRDYADGDFLLLQSVLDVQQPAEDLDVLFVPAGEARAAGCSPSRVQGIDIVDDVVGECIEVLARD